MMKFVLTNLAAIAMAAAMLSPAAASSCKSQGNKHAGLYELQDVMEVGSLIWLNKQGQFQYMMSYGAVDEVAEGCWTTAGSNVVLTPTSMRVSYGGNKFQKLTLKIKSRGKLVRNFGGGQNGTYLRIRR